MKKKLTLTLLALLALTLAGCEPKEQTQIEKDVESHITEISYKGHKYLYFHKYDGLRHAVAGITHDPDCPCRESSAKPICSAKKGESHD